jgi:hypothetical protein
MMVSCANSKGETEKLVRNLKKDNSLYASLLDILRYIHYILTKLLYVYVFCYVQ